MRALSRLLEVAAEHGGYLTPSLAAEVGVGDGRLRVLASRRELEHSGHGLYRIPAFPVTPHDELHRAVLWPDGRGVISHESAAALHDLADVNPRTVHLTVPYRVRRRGGDQYRLWVAELEREDLDERFGLPVTSVPRTLTDLVAIGTDPGLVRQALRTATQRGLIEEVAAARILVSLADRDVRARA